MSATNRNPTVRLDRAQRQALREEIRDTAGDCRDINLALEQGNREFVVREARQLQRLVAALDAIGWTEPPDAPDDQTVTVDRELALWARSVAVELERSFADYRVGDRDLDTLRALCVIAEADCRILATGQDTHCS